MAPWEDCAPLMIALSNDHDRFSLLRVQFVRPFRLEVVLHYCVHPDSISEFYSRMLESQRRTVVLVFLTESAETSVLREGTVDYCSATNVPGTAFAIYSPTSVTAMVDEQEVETTHLASEG
jgi:hypothetical protein